MIRLKHFEFLYYLNTKRDIKNWCMNLNNGYNKKRHAAMHAEYLVSVQ